MGTIWDKINKIKEEGNKRKSLCNTCVFLEKSSRQCSLCGCFVDAKTLVPTAKCPKGKW